MRQISFKKTNLNPWHRMLEIKHILKRFSPPWKNNLKTPTSTDVSSSAVSGLFFFVPGWRLSSRSDRSMFWLWSGCEWMENFKRTELNRTTVCFQGNSSSLFSKGIMWLLLIGQNGLSVVTVALIGQEGQPEKTKTGVNFETDQGSDSTFEFR